MGEDQRHSERVSYRCEVECSGVDGVSAGTAEIGDLSVTGAFIDTLIEFPVGKRLLLRLHLPLGLLVIQAEVAHVMQNFGMGVRFVGVTAEQQAALEAVLRGGA